jgi:hypothetical protein
MRCCQYIGSNGAEILAMYNEIAGSTGLTYAIQSDTGTTLTITGKFGTTPFLTLVTQVNNYSIVTSGSHAGENITLTDLEYVYRTYGTQAQLLGQTTAFAAAVAQHQATGSGAFGSLANIVVPGLSSANFTVNVAPTFPNTFLVSGTWTYKAAPVLTGSASLLGSLSITNINATTRLVNDADKLSGSQVRVTVQNSGALQLSGAAILVHCTPT